MGTDKEEITVKEVKGLLKFLDGLDLPLAYEAIYGMASADPAGMVSLLKGYKPELFCSTIKDQCIEVFREAPNSGKIYAIKYHRSLTGMGLKESKEQIETWLAEEGLE